MIFSSGLFLSFFLPVFLILFFAVGRRFRNTVLLLASLAFFAWGAPAFVLVVLASLLADYILNTAMAKATGGARRALLQANLLLNLGLLAYFKYANFFVENANGVLRGLGFHEVLWMKVALPLGISFIVLQKISYAVDVYRRRTAPARDWVGYATFILMFPKLLAGPIVRFGDIAGAIAVGGETTSADVRLAGFLRFAVGLAKKVLIADVLSGQVNLILARPPAELSSGLAWLAALGFTFQIYFDFSGYSDMAIGLAAAMGFRFPENFNDPYVSRSVTEFWRRWHMTLSAWLRDYVFLPVAYSVSRRLKRDRYLGLRTEQWIYLPSALLTMLLCGFWHGAAWNFVLWGLYMGGLLVLERLFLLRFYRRKGRLLALPATFLLTVVGWMVFRAESVPKGLFLIRRLFDLTPTRGLVEIDMKFYAVLALAAVLSFAGLIRGREARRERLYQSEKRLPVRVALTFAGAALFLLSLAAVASAGFAPFIYFRF